MPLYEIVQKLYGEEKWLTDCYELWGIDIAIACEDEDNQEIPFPIKRCRYKENAEYQKLLPSMGEPGQETSG